jgi:hypothetical protein
LSLNGTSLVLGGEGNVPATLIQRAGWLSIEEDDCRVSDGHKCAVSNPNK